MFHVTFRLPLLLVLFLLRHTKAVSDQCCELQSEISRLNKLNHRNELLVDQCYGQLKTETHVSEAAFRSLKLEEDKSKSKLRQMQQLEAEKNELKKRLDEFKITFEQLEAKNKDLEKRLGEDEMFFYIQSVDSGKYLDIRGGSKENGAQVVIYEFSGGKTQQWSYKKGRIVSRLNGLVLDISGRKKTGVIIMSENGGDYQKWYFEDDQTIRSELHLVLDVKYSSKQNGSPVIAFGKHSRNNQKFRVLPVAK